MKSRHSPALVLLLTIGACVLAPLNHSVAREHSPSRSPVANGRLIMKFSPVLGINVGVGIRIDGRPAGAITKGHVFDREISPGPHLVSVYRNGRLRDAWEARLNVRPGETYAYVIKYSVNQIVLEPTGSFR